MKSVDLHEYLGGPNLCPTTPHPITGETVPLTFGHEFGGVVEEVGDGVTDYKSGDRVIVQPIIYCGTCSACVEGLQNCCWSNGFVGLSGGCNGPSGSSAQLQLLTSIRLGRRLGRAHCGAHINSIPPPR
jgi:threonine dehydrogenase-like Zn-dependent dehydrogenase